MMKLSKNIQEHLFSLMVVSITLIAIAIILNPQPKQVITPPLYKELEFVDLHDPFQQALLKDMLDLYQPDAIGQNALVVEELVSFSTSELDAFQETALQKNPFTSKTSLHILGMYLKFILIYVLVLLLTYYGVQTLAVWMFIRKEQNQAPFLVSIIEQLRKIFRKQKISKLLNLLGGFTLIIAKGFLRAVLYTTLFTPAYVTAYSIKSDFNTDSLFFMILLGVISNGLLITYANKFFTLLISESRKGYVLTARVKNLKNSYFSNMPDGISFKSVLAIHKNFNGHVFQHIYINTRIQYLDAIKEQASFVISGLVIIEMALNIHGHYTYELMQQLLYKNYHYVVLMILGIFILVKLTDITTEYLKYRESKRMES